MRFGHDSQITGHVWALDPSTHELENLQELSSTLKLEASVTFSATNDIFTITLLPEIVMLDHWINTRTERLPPPE